MMIRDAATGPQVPHWQCRRRATVTDRDAGSESESRVTVDPSLTEPDCHWPHCGMTMIIMIIMPVIASESVIRHGGNFNFRPLLKWQAGRWPGRFPRARALPRAGLAPAGRSGPAAGPPAGPCGRGHAGGPAAVTVPDPDLGTAVSSSTVSEKPARDY